MCAYLNGITIKIEKGEIEIGKASKLVDRGKDWPGAEFHDVYQTPPRVTFEPCYQ